MLTADLVNVRRRKGELQLVDLDEEARVRARSIADTLIAEAIRCVGGTREDLEAALAAGDIGAREVRLRDGLVKLIEDRCRFSANEDVDVEGLRCDVFTSASRVRAALEPGMAFDRASVIGAAAARWNLSPEALDAALFADLRAAHVLLGFDAPSAAALVNTYVQSQAQAVLLRAVKITVEIRGASPLALRALFRKLKFLRVLHTIAKSDHGIRIVIDGPFSLFESATKYGLQLALVLPALECCDVWSLEADVRWGKTREALVFKLASPTPNATSERAPWTEPALPTEVEELVKKLRALDSEWTVEPNMEVLELPGVGLTVPDLVFEKKPAAKKSSKAKTSKAKTVAGAADKPIRVYLEVMGYWSRAAVWQRVELVQAGLPERVLFALSSRLRVSEAVLEGDLPSALYVYKGAINAREILERVQRLGNA